MGRCRSAPLRLAAIAGIFFAGDLLIWHHAIEYVGAGLATVLGNLQVLIVGVVAWLVLGERPSRATLLALPVVLVGVVLISGVIGTGAYGANPALGVVLGIGDRAVLLGLPARDPARWTRPAAAGGAGGDRDGRHGPRGGCGRGRSSGDLDLAPPLASLAGWPCSG